MDTIRYVLIFFIIFSIPTYADTYPATQTHRCGSSPGSSYGDACQAAAESLGDNYGTVNGEVCTVRRNSDNVLLSSFSCFILYTCPYGGTLSGSECINASPCESGFERNTTTGQCVPPPPTCPPQGEKRSIAVCKTEIQETGGILNIDIDGGGYQHTANYNGCVYHYSDADYVPENGTQQSGCYVPSGQTPINGQYNICCSYDATSSGESTTAPDSAQDSTQKTGSTPVDANSDATCKTDSKGNQVCKDAPVTPTQQCGSVNGTKVCVDSVDTTKPPTINGKPIDLQGKNCGWVNGVLKCVGDTPSSPTVEGCVTGTDGRTYCVNRDTKTTTEETTTTNPDGTITKTVTTKTNTIGEDDKTTTTTTNPDGTKTTTTTGGDGSGDGKTDCDKYPNSIGCQDISKGDAPKADTIPTIDVPIVFNPVSWGGSGSCPAPGTINLHGSTVEISYQPYCDIASAIRPIVIALAFMSAAYIVFGGVKE
ncbi:virulence factor TspB C-terminal domain-related protein [Methylobacter sp. Wu1]|uniref:virulence factor TspB C-terminal domain-related protein n=1 Tax=Methylobacter sp. Wu1 TaxID=3119359 RepID=UPI002F95C560